MKKFELNVMIGKEKVGSLVGVFLSDYSTKSPSFRKVRLESGVIGMDILNESIDTLSGFYNIIVETIASKYPEKSFSINTRIYNEE
jgi:hypothetical protein